MLSHVKEGRSAAKSRAVRLAEKLNSLGYGIEECRNQILSSIRPIVAGMEEIDALLVERFAISAAEYRWAEIS